MDILIFLEFDDFPYYVSAHNGHWHWALWGFRDIQKKKGARRQGCGVANLKSWDLGAAPVLGFLRCKGCHRLVHGSKPCATELFEE